MTPSTPSQIDVEREFSRRLTVHKSLDQEVVVTTVDKVRLCLLENQECLKTRREWVTPLSLFLTLLASLFATEFKDFGLAAPVWEAIFVLGAAASAVWFLIGAVSAWRNRTAGGVEQIVEELKAHTVVDPETDEFVDGNSAY